MYPECEECYWHNSPNGASNCEFCKSYYERLNKKNKFRELCEKIKKKYQKKELDDYTEDCYNKTLKKKLYSTDDLSPERIPFDY